MLLLFVWDGVIAVTPKRVAPSDSACCEQASLNGAMLFQRF